MSYEITSWAWKQDDLPHTPKVVLLALADYADTEKGECFPSVSGIATKLGYSPTSRPAIRKAITDLEDRGLITKKGRTRVGTHEQTSHLYTINWRTAPKTTKEVGVNNTHVGVENTRGGCSGHHEPVTEPITEPITSPTPSPLRDDEEKNPIAIEQSSTPIDSFAEDQTSDRVKRQEVMLRTKVASMARSNDDDYPVKAEEFVEAFESIHGYGNGLKDAGHMFWNQRYDERLGDLISTAQAEMGDDRGFRYGVAKWLGIFTNDFNA